MAGRTKGRQVVAAATLVLVVGFGAWFAWAANQEPETRFCTLGMPIIDIDGQTVVPQDSASPGKDGCDGSETMEGSLVLGFDCKVREDDGDVVATFEPNRDDGTCGLSDGNEGFPESWSLD